MTDTVYIALGSNLGDRHATLSAARAKIGSLKGVRVVGESSVEETEPIGPVTQPPYLNQMLAVETSVEPGALLTELHRIERECGRIRRERWGPRTLDLDIVKFGERTFSSAELTLPHPEISNRDFWKREMCEIQSSLTDSAGETR